MKLLSDPFQVYPTGTAVKYQMELTDIQNDSDFLGTILRRIILFSRITTVKMQRTPGMKHKSQLFEAVDPFKFHVI